MRKRKKSLIILVLFLILVLGLGYAYLTTTLSIHGTTDVDSNTWNIYFDNVIVKNGSVTANTPVIDTNKTTVSFQVRLSKPGDYYEFTVDAKNDGTIDGMIDTITKTTNIPDYLNYIVTYDDDIVISENQFLKANTKEIYKVRVEYRSDISADNLPATPQSINLSFSVNYIQANSNAVEVPHPTIVYTANTEYGLFIGQSIPNNITQYNSFEEASARYNELFNNPDYTIVFKHILKDDIVTDSYLVFSYPELKSGLYELRGFDNYGKNSSELCSPGYYDQEHNTCLSPYYENNKNILLDYFGEENCIYVDLMINCSSNDFSATANNSGNVAIRINSDWYSQVNYEGAKYVNGPY